MDRCRGTDRDPTALHRLIGRARIVLIPHRALIHLREARRIPKLGAKISIALDALFAEGRQTVDPAARAEVYKKICTIMNEEVYWANMWVTTRFGGVSNEVQNFVWTPAPGGGRYYDAAETWSVPAS